MIRPLRPWEITRAAERAVITAAINERLLAVVDQWTHLTTEQIAEAKAIAASGVSLWAWVARHDPLMSEVAA